LTEDVMAKNWSKTFSAPYTFTHQFGFKYLRFNHKTVVTSSTAKFLSFMVVALKTATAQLTL